MKAYNSPRFTDHGSVVAKTFGSLASQTHETGSLTGHADVDSPPGMTLENGVQAADTTVGS